MNPHTLKQIAEHFRALAALHEELALDEITPSPERKPAPPSVVRQLPERQPSDMERAQARRALRRVGVST